MAQRANNRIEVDLKLLQDRNIEKLLDFGSKFDESIKRLSVALENQVNVAAGGGAAQVVQQAGRLGPAASTGVTLTQPGVTPARMGGAMAGGDVKTGFYNSGSGSIADADGVSSEKSVEQGYAKASKRIGAVPVGLRQTLGYAAEGALDLSSIGITPERAGKINDSLFAGQAIMANAKLLYGGLQQAYGMVQGPTMLGQQLGQSREGGFLGTGLGSAAFNRGVGELWQTGKLSDFGLNPNFTPGQARDVQKTVEQYGYSVSTGPGKQIASALKELKIHSGLDPGDVMTYLDPFTRFGSSTQSGTQLLDAIRGIPEAARVASMNLGVFTKALNDTAVGVAQAMGTTPGAALPTLEAFSQTTGLSPSVIKGQFTGQNALVASAITGQPIAKLMENPNAAAMEAMPNFLFKQLTGGKSAASLLDLRHKDPNAYYAAMGNIYKLYATNPEALGGMTPLQWLQTQARNGGKWKEHQAITQDVGQTDWTKNGSVAHIQKLMGEYGGSLGKKFQDDRKEYLKSHTVQTAAEKKAYRKKMYEDAQDLLGKKQKKAGQKAAVEVTVGFNQQAAQWLTVLKKQLGGDKSSSNQQGFFGRMASGEKKIAMYPFDHPGKTADAIGSGIGDAADAAGSFLKQSWDKSLDW